MNKYIIKTQEGKEFVSVEGKTVLESALAAGFVFEHSCKNGQCGVCKTTLLQGKIIQIQEQLALNNKDGSNQFLTCC